MKCCVNNKRVYFVTLCDAILYMFMGILDRWFGRGKGGSAEPGADGVKSVRDESADNAENLNVSLSPEAREHRMEVAARIQELASKAEPIMQHIVLCSVDTVELLLEGKFKEVRTIHQQAEDLYAGMGGIEPPEAVQEKMRTLRRYSEALDRAQAAYVAWDTKKIKRNILAKRYNEPRTWRDGAFHTPTEIIGQEEGRDVVAGFRPLRDIMGRFETP